MYFSAGEASIFELQAYDDTMSKLSGERTTMTAVKHAGHGLVPEQPGETERLLADWVKGHLR